MNDAVPCLDTAYFVLGEIEASRAAARRVIPIIAQFPLIEELWPAYHTVIDYFKDKKEAGQALDWIEILRSKAAERQELVSLARAVLLRGITLSEQGDLQGAQPVLQEALAMSQRIGETIFQYQCLHRFAINALMLGEKETACRYVDELLALMQTFEPAAPDQYAFCGHILLGAGQVERGLALLTQAFADCESAGTSPMPQHRLWLGQALVAVGCHEEAKQHFQQLLETAKSERYLVPDYPDLPPVFPAAVAALDALLDDQVAFQRVCEHLRCVPHYPDLHNTGATASRYWYPVSTEIADKANGAINQPVSDAELAAWHWCDPLGDGAYTIDLGVEITAADARDLWIINLSAPSLRTRVEENFVLQALCTPSPQRPTTMGGLLLWRGPQNFVRLDWGGLGPGEISCLGCHNGYETVWGRGRTQCQQVFLRIERRGHQVRALFSEDAIHWRLVGEVIFPVADDRNKQASDHAADTGWEAGFLALGAINRTLYPQSSPGGAAVHFREIQLRTADRTRPIPKAFSAK